MSTLSRKETAALIAITIVLGTFVTGTLYRNYRASEEPGITLHEAFAQPPGAPPPGRPTVVSTPVSSSPTPASSGATNTSPMSSTSVAPSETGAPASGENGAAAPVAASTSAEIVVHVAGAVKKPGVYHLPAGSRNDDAIQKAGGATAEANTDGINLASRVEDGSQLYIPTHKQHPEGGADAPTLTASATPISAVSSAATKTNAKAGTKSDGHAAAKSTGSAKGGKGGKLTDPGQGTVNINTADAEELQRVPGIGPAMAERVLEFRKSNGKFTAVEDLLNISGIGEKKFAKMQPFVRVR